MQACIIIFTLLALLFRVQSAPLVARGSESGQGTYYEVGLGSCGKTNTNSQMVAALSGSIMKSSYCGKSITVKGPNGSVSLKVVDTCPGCKKGDVDMSAAAFKKIASLSDGRVPITWSL
ncbi:RlpA-like double-psi beta-barrel-protein domain-containing protein-containing protein [Mucor mucedo]|uniref:RlpA-like double-psi beta-barrel-protein domain-containing protein-containing protein n=1 Tax=Mucor mucedo TaxID=29922 RepID=UPI00221E5AE4|nr:RlpA-like double-psi beta-barrel-protein domain-containing protein-containing protein [Mucor mucedo]KAI7884466.1 RlpA-like double-psi beta-barrel-protein domain-containing protein-containing protein [Mucor mucedo]